MRRRTFGRYGNGWSRLAAWFTAFAHSRAPALRWGVLIALAALLVVSGYVGLAQESVGSGRGALDLSDAAYQIFGALAMADFYFDAPNPMLQIARFAGLAIPLVGLFFAFSGALGRSLAQACRRGASRHVVIAGGGAPALSLAQDCVRKHDDVVLIARGVSDETARDLGARGVMLIEGDASRQETMRDARAHHAAHVVAFEESDSTNLQIEAVTRALLGKSRRTPPIGVHVAARSPVLLQESREMRSLEQVRRDKAAQAAKSQNRALPPPPGIDPKPFSMDELAARHLIQKEAATIFAVAERHNHPRPHLVFFGFDEGAEAVAVRALMSLWSARLEPPRLTMCVPDEARAARRFHARYPQASAHPELWAADIAFMPFDSTGEKVDAPLLQRIAAARGPASAIIVSTGEEAENVLLALALKRACNQGLIWPVPIYMREASQSEFSRQYARGDDTPDIDDAFLQAFGAHQKIATRAFILDGALDRGAAIAHRRYVMGVGERDHAALRDLQAAARGWGEVMETYRAANRAVADSATVKLWDAGWRPAGRDDRPKEAVMAPVVPQDMILPMARREHDRWVAERLMSGWRPGDRRDNEMRIHPNLKPWDALTDDEKDRDVVQVKAALDIARMMHRGGFMVRAASSADGSSRASNTGH